jgi:multidrug efflux pump subunit AcrB
MVKLYSSKSARERFNISRLAMEFSWLTVSFWIAVMVAGVLAFSSLKYALFPDVAFPVVVVNAQAPLKTAVETESKLTKLLERKLTTIKGLDTIRSSTYPGQTSVSLSFDVGTNLEASTNNTIQMLKEINLPKGVSYKIISLNLNESSAVSYAIGSSSRSLEDLSQLAKKQILPSVAKLPGVLKVSLLGDGYAQAPKLTANQTPPVGTLVRFNGKNALALQVIKKANANTLEVVKRVEQAVKQLQQNLPDVTLSLAATQAEYINQATHSTIDALIEAIVLSVVIIYPFLGNWQATLISALAIPTSLLGTFIVMAIYGFNLETITLLALALVIGTIVDDAIVDVENIIRHIELGKTPRQAAIAATDEIGLTVTAATLTAVAVFLPIGLMNGVIGQFFKPFGITVSAAMLTSLLVARTLSPVISIYWLKPKNSNFHRRDSYLWVRFNQSYQDLLKWSLANKWFVVGLAGLSLIGGIALIPLIPQGFIPQLDRGEFNIVYTAPLSLSTTNPLQDSLQVAQKLEKLVRESPEVETVFTTVGSREGEPNKGTLYVKLSKQRQVKTAEIQAKLRTELSKFPLVTTSVEDIQFVDSGSQKPLELALQGDNLSTLSQAAKAVKKRIEKLPGFADVAVTGNNIQQGEFQEIARLNNQRVAYISANLGKNLSLGDATNQVISAAKAVIPPGVSFDLGGDSERQEEVFSSFGTTLVLSALCIILVLVWLFKSWVDPIAIAISLPLALVGALIALLLTKSDFGMISLIGFVFLLGITNKNAILIVDYINQLRRSGLERTEAILKAGPIRLRPIMMTTSATILGMVPIALGLGAGSELRSPMAIAIAGGLVSSTILSLVVVPVVYAILDDILPRFRQKSSRETQ